MKAKLGQVVQMRGVCCGIQGAEQGIFVFAKP